MSVSANSGRGSGLTRYDLVLLCIPVAFLLAAVTSLMLEIPTHAATAAGGLVSAFVLADALFRNPPLGT
jgi:hypothetical protein